MAKLLHKDVRDAILTDAGLTVADAASFALARQVAAFVKSRGLAGLDLADTADRAALAAAVGTADVNLLTKAVAVAQAAGFLVVGF